MRNIVLVTFDSLRADHCGHFGYNRDTTPTLDDMAGNGISFANAIAPASRTNPSMAGAFTGEPVVVRDRVDDPKHARKHLQRYPTIAERLSDAGYTTGAFCPNAYASRYYGFDEGFDQYEDFLFGNDLYQTLFSKHLSDSNIFTAVRNVRNLLRRQEAFKTWDTYIDDIEQWVETQEEPFFLWVFSLDTHFPYLTPRSSRRWSNVFEMYYYNWWCNQLIDKFDIDLSDWMEQKIIDIYDDALYFGDQLLAELRSRLSDYDPVYVVHGDHGEAFGDHGVYGHFYPSLYEESIHVPLVVSEADTQAPIGRPISLLDLPELMDLISGSHMGDVPGMGGDWVVATDYDGRTDRNLTAVRTEQWKYIRTEKNGDVSEQLYDVAADQSEQQDLSDTHSMNKPLRQLAERQESHERELLTINFASRQFSDLK